MNDDKRWAVRERYEDSLAFSVSVLELHELKRLDLSGTIINKSDLGLCLQTDYPLEPGHVLMFNHGSGYDAGIVVWRRPDLEQFKIGVKFV